MDDHGGVRLAVEHVSKSFGGVRALNDVCLIAEPGKVTALIGANGSGKTTLLNTISGFLAPESGVITLSGERIERRSATHLARIGIRRTFQTPIIPESTPTEDAVAVARYEVDRVGVLAAIVRAPSFWKVARSDRWRARGALQLCDLIEHADHTAASLPLGLRRLVEVARVVVSSPRVVLLDEPAAGLEAAELADLERVIRILRDHGLTIILVEHNFDFIRSLADTAYVLDRGTVICSGDIGSVAQDPVVVERYFGGRAPAPAPGAGRTR